MWVKWNSHTHAHYSSRRAGRSRKFEMFQQKQTRADTPTCNKTWKMWTVQMFGYTFSDFWSTVDSLGIYWKQEAEAERMFYTNSLKLISLNKNISYYWLNKHIFFGWCQAAAIYDTVIWRIMSEPGLEFNMSQMCEENGLFYQCCWV